ncbi:TetR/AcrR family transcriptional regulator [Paenibacillus assamensis]|uniref:TetR/AcrR family transcriptional regulator n=1 Tax=Paenibacillus assamensis TaxID=311244 RepID=UPI0003F56FDA|nr:TetR/AcrR family transcriptional regulator [Paenibacillus assamensis]
MKKRKSSNRDIVLRVAAELFLKAGYHSTSMDDIVAISKVSKTNIYYHFASKEAILLEIVDDAVAYYDARSALIRSQQHVEVITRIEFLLRLIAYDPYQQDCRVGGTFLTLFAQTSREVPAVRERIDQFFRRHQQFLEQLLEEGITTGQLHVSLPIPQTAALVLSIFEGSLFLSEVYQDSDHLQHVFQSLEWLMRLHAPLRTNC